MQPGNDSAFTLVELMAATAIVAVLAGLLLSSYSLVRVQRNLTRSTTNLSTINQGFQLYAADNNGEICPGSDSDRTSAGLYPMYPKYIAPYVGGLSQLGLPDSVFQSPADPNVQYGGSYTMNASVDKLGAGRPTTRFVQFAPEARWLFLFEGDAPGKLSGAGHSGTASDVALRYDKKGLLLFLDGHIETRATIDASGTGFWKGLPSPPTP